MKDKPDKDEYKNNEVVNMCTYKHKLRIKDTYF